MAGMNKLLKQAKKMQEKMEKLNKELENSLIEVETGGGAVTITIAGDSKINAIKIDPEVVDKDDVEGLEDLLVTAFNQAIDEAKEYSDKMTKEITGDMQLPGGLSF